MPFGCCCIVFIYLQKYPYWKNVHRNHMKLHASSFCCVPHTMLNTRGNIPHFNRRFWLNYRNNLIWRDTIYTPGLQRHSNSRKMELEHKFRGQSCSTVVDITTCEASILYERWLKCWMFHFFSSSFCCPWESRILQVFLRVSPCWSVRSHSRLLSLA